MVLTEKLEKPEDGLHDGDLGRHLLLVLLCRLVGQHVVHVDGGGAASGLFLLLAPRAPH